MAIFLLCIISTVWGLARYLYKWFKSKGYPRAGIVLLAGMALYSVYCLYRGVYPEEEFYLEEFERITYQSPPTSAKIIRKEASYPDFHGDYCSAALITLSHADFDKLLFNLTADYRMRSTGSGRMGGSKELETVLGSRKEEAVIKHFVRDLPAKAGQHLQIGFFSDYRTIAIGICKT
jgi:hypothetical protein